MLNHIGFVKILIAYLYVVFVNIIYMIQNEPTPTQGYGVSSMGNNLMIDSRVGVPDQGN